MMEERVDWDTLWMTMALAVAQRSIDNITKCGCIIVDDKNHLVSMGYNSFPRECIEIDLPLEKPDKYKVIIHSETNAIINAGNRDLTGTTAYITGHPCSNCFGNMLNAGISKIVYGPVDANCVNEDDIYLINHMNISSKTFQHKISIVKYDQKHNFNEINIFIDQIKKYFKKYFEYKEDSN